jgi:hypothetical protein
LFHEQLPFLHFSLAMQDETGLPEHLFEKYRDVGGHFPELCKEENLLLARCNHFHNLAQPRKLAAIALRPLVVAQPL